MTLIRKWASALCLALLSLNCSKAETSDSSTGNLVNFTGTPTATTGNWVNGVYVNALTCWEPGGPGNCGPYPNVQTNGTINFSYGQVDLNQVVNINNALQAAGTGVQVTGFHYGFRAKNGNGWDNGQQDYLDAYVRFYNPQAKVVEAYNYANYTNKQYGWTDFNFNETFNKPYNVAKLGAAQYGFVGRDTNGWAGPYGPEIQNVSFSLNYRIDPCVANPVSSPSCPGFGNLVKSNAVVVPTASTGTSSASDTTTATPVVEVGGAQLSSTGTISAPDNIPQALKDAQAASQSSAAQSTDQSTTKSSPNMSLIMSTISRIQANDRAAQSSAVQNANRAMAASSAAAQEQAMAVAEASNNSNSSSSQSAQQASQTAMSSQSPMASAIAAQDRGMPGLQFSLSNTSAGRSEFADGSTGLLLAASNSISMNDLLSARMNIDTATNNATTDTVNRNVQPNELAGRMDIANIATQPKGFDVYATLIIKDADFYAPKDIYGNQRTIDNARALRLLSSDRLHQEMIDLQYRR